jgi:hypothetical protein
MIVASPKSLMYRTIDRAVNCTLRTMAPRDAVGREESTKFIVRTLIAMQPLYRSLVVFVLLYLNIESLIRTGKLFPQLTDERASRIFTGWSKSWFGPKQKLSMLISTLATIAYFDNRQSFAKSGLDWDRYIALQRFYDSGA